MRTITLSIVCTALIFSCLTLNSCVKDECQSTQTYVRWDPVHMTLDEMRQDIQVLPARDLQEPGNIYYYNGYMLINEILEGVHIIDNSDPSNPMPLAFIDIPGSRDMAVKDDVLYIDSYLDLLSIDISTPTQPKLLYRTEDIFQSYIPFNDEFGYVTEYVETDVTEVVNCTDSRWGGQTWWRGGSVFLEDALSNTKSNSIPSSSSGQSAGGVGIGGSLARFTISKGHLYALDQWQMQVFELNGFIPEHRNGVSMGGGIETVFPYKENLFIGTNLGMKIYDISNPATPVYLSEFAHAFSCDPVFATDDIAYVTLRDGTPCANANNQLDVIDIKDLTNPKLIKSYPMGNPHGLSVVGNTLYLCDGRNGLKVFDVEDSKKIDQNLLDHIGHVEAKDVIALPSGSEIMVIGPEGMRQYDVTDRTALKEISFMALNK